MSSFRMDLRRSQAKQRPLGLQQTWQTKRNTGKLGRPHVGAKNSWHGSFQSLQNLVVGNSGADNGAFVRESDLNGLLRMHLFNSSDTEQLSQPVRKLSKHLCFTWSLAGRATQWIYLPLPDFQTTGFCMGRTGLLFADYHVPLAT